MARTQRRLLRPRSPRWSILSQYPQRLHLTRRPPPPRKNLLWQRPARHKKRHLNRVAPWVGRPCLAANFARSKRSRIKTKVSPRCRLVPNRPKPITLLRENFLGQLELLQRLVGLVVLLDCARAGRELADWSRRPLATNWRSFRTAVVYRSLNLRQVEQGWPGVRPPYSKARTASLPFSSRPRASGAS